MEFYAIGKTFPSFGEAQEAAEKATIKDRCPHKIYAVVATVSVPEPATITTKHIDLVRLQYGD